MADITDLLPPSLNLPAHLSAHKYFFVCTLTVAAWDSLVLSPRGWRLMKTKEWPALKIIFHFLRLFMPAEFVIVGERCSLLSFSFHGGFRMGRDGDVVCGRMLGTNGRAVGGGETV